MLIGGAGASLSGDGNEDFLIDSSTNIDNSLSALAAIRDAWTSGETYELRVTDTRAAFNAGQSGGGNVTGGNGRDAFATTGADVQTNESIGDQIHAIHDNFDLAIAQTISDSVLNNDNIVFGGGGGPGIADVSIVQQAMHGTVSVDDQGNFSYTQTTHGRDSFVYEITDTNGRTSQARASIVVDGLPPLPDGAVLSPTGSGLEIFEFVVGNGASPELTNTATIDYIGYLPNGQIFDRNDDIAFPLQNVIAGFGEGVAGMNIGGSRRIVIPSELGYGPNGLPRAGIGGMDSIIFDVTLHSFT